MKKISLFLLLGILAISSCKKYVKEKDLDKQVIVNFPFGMYWSSKSPTFENAPSGFNLVDFDKRDYPKVDSITFNVELATEVLTDSVYARLFNVTDSVEIPNTLLSASTNGTGSSLVAVHTNNIYKSLPDKKITLAVQLKGKTGRYVYVYSPYLKLRRN